MEKEKLLTVRQFANEIGLTEAAVYKAINKGKVKSSQETEGFKVKKYIPASELEKFKTK